MEKNEIYNNDNAHMKSKENRKEYKTERRKNKYYDYIKSIYKAFMLILIVNKKVFIFKTLKKPYS